MPRANQLDAAAAAHRPRAARRSMLRRLAHTPVGYRLFQRLGRAYGIEGVSAQGDFGLVTGPLDDAAVLQAYVLNGFWARAANQFFSGFFSRTTGGTYIDVGANLGLTTIPVAQNPHVTCRAFEPAPQNFKYLWHNIAENCRHGNVGAFNVALFDRQTTIEMTLAPRNSAGARVCRDAGPSDGTLETVQVRAERLDDVLEVNELPRPIAAKIASRGAELRVLAGGAAVLGAAEAIALEFDPALIREFDDDIATSTDFLVRHFTSAAALRGPDAESNDMRQPLVWHPVSAIIREMREMMRQASTPGADYCHIYFRR